MNQAMKQAMKQWLCKGVMVVVMATALALIGLPGGSVLHVEAGKVVSKTTLGPVTNLKYDAKKNRISWDKTANVLSYRVEVENASGSRVLFSDTDKVLIEWPFSPGTYTASVRATDTTSFYPIASNVKSLDDYSYTKDYDLSIKNLDGTYTLYNNPVGPVSTITFTIPPKLSTSTTAISTLPGIRISDKIDWCVIVEPVQEPYLYEGESIIWEASNNKEFLNDRDRGLILRTSETTSSNYRWNVYINYSDFNSGDTVYVRARVYNPNYAYKTSEMERYGAYTKAIVFHCPSFEITQLHAAVTDSGIQLNADITGTATGYQFAKKVGSKWVDLGTQMGNIFVDKAVSKNATYEYRARAYRYNTTTKKTVWTGWTNVKALVWGSTLDFKAAAAGSTSVKLTWKPVSGAQGYEIYRKDLSSYGSTTYKGVITDEYAGCELIKTFKKQKAKSYTDKKLAKNTGYDYLIRAYKTIGKKKVYIEDTASVSLKPGNMTGVTSYVRADGKMVVSWNKMTGLKGYYLEVFDKKTNDYVRYKTLKASASSYTFDQVRLGEDEMDYRIIPFDTNRVYDEEHFCVRPTLAAPKNVKAVKTAKGVRISWSAVPGADYYSVYRTTSDNYTYNKLTKTYSYPNIIGTYEKVYEAVLNTENRHPELGEEGYNEAKSYRTERIVGTSVEDKPLNFINRVYDEKRSLIPIGKNAAGQTLYQTREVFYYGIEGPEPGTTYHYYVVANAMDTNGAYNSGIIKSECTKAATITYTNLAAKKVSKITSVKSKKKGQATVSFKKVKGVDGYAIFRSSKKNGTYALIGCVDGKKASFTDTSAPAGKTAYYKVASYIKGEKRTNIYSAKTVAKSVKVKK